MNPNSELDTSLTCQGPEVVTCDVALVNWNVVNNKENIILPTGDVLMYKFVLESVHTSNSNNTIGGKICKILQNICNKISFEYFSANPRWHFRCLREHWRMQRLVEICNTKVVAEAGVYYYIISIYCNSQDKVISGIAVNI